MFSRSILRLLFYGQYKAFIGNEMKNIKKIHLSEVKKETFRRAIFREIDSVLTSKTSCFTILQNFSMIDLDYLNF
jgi:hypothetical protein